MIVSIDTGGTKTLIASFSKNGSIAKQFRFATPKTEIEYIEAIKDALNNNFNLHDIEAIVVAMPGIVKSGVALWCNNLGWQDFNVEQQLRQFISSDIKILIENDANLAGLSEARLLSPIPRQALYATVSTGIGTGIITDGQIDPSIKQSEGGRMLIEYGGKVQEWEQFASGKAILNTYGKYAKDIDDEKTWTEIADRISRGFLVIIPLLQPEIIIVGGSIGTYFEKYQSQLVQTLENHLPSHIPCPKIVKAKNPEQAVIYGGYIYALDQLDLS